ncbi:DJ-1/PfpI family protein [Pantoea rodasii]|uniref:DJ-1/PfpI family protein n=1 Tax=Pantoea rodasii TaxID=1076549 RepID=UPI00345250A1
MNHQITLLAVPGTQLLDVSGPLDVFAEANRVLNRTVYHLRVMSLDSATVQCSSGVRLLADMMLADQHQPHTFLIAGAPDAMKLALTATQIEQVIQLCQGSQRYGSVCTGALLLAQTGLLRGKKSRHTGHVLRRWPSRFRMRTWKRMPCMLPMVNCARLLA